MKNKNLNKAKENKNDEFYTRFEDIKREVLSSVGSDGQGGYKSYFKGRTIYCNCDADWSNFVKFFEDEGFIELGIKKLIATHYSEEGSYKIEVDVNGKTITKLQGNGDFRSNECVALLTEADIVVTNPPFSLFREFVSLMETHNKKYLIVGSMNAITYKETFKLIKDNKLWLGVNSVKSFVTPDGGLKTFGNICWYTNLQHHKRNEALSEAYLYKDQYGGYQKYDNYDAIEVSRVSQIPMDYDGVMGVPITFLTKYNPEQFEILDANDYRHGAPINDLTARPLLDGKEVYRRILIKRKNLK